MLVAVFPEIMPFTSFALLSVLVVLIPVITIHGGIDCADSQCESARFLEGLIQGVNRVGESLTIPLLVLLGLNFGTRLIVVGGKNNVATQVRQEALPMASRDPSEVREVGALQIKELKGTRFNGKLPFA